MIFPTVLILAGLVFLAVGGEFLVRGASGMAAALRIAPLVIGLTVVAFGTSAPELAVTTASALKGEADLAIGNVVGSNICNVLFILGLSALIAPLVVSSQLIRWDVPLMIAASVLTYLLAMDGEISRWDGLLLFAGVVAYTFWSIRLSRREKRAVQEEFAEEYAAPEERAASHAVLNVVFVAGGLLLLGLGADWLVGGAVTIARIVGISELVIGLTIVAVGTSLPEAAASLVAALRGEREIAVGNVVGSNLFNLLCVLGLTGMIAPRGIPISETALWIDMPIMIAVFIACLPVFFTGGKISRWNGAMLLGYYLAYLTDLVLRALEVPFAADFRLIVLFFVLPLTLIALFIGVIRTWLTPPRALQDLPQSHGALPVEQEQGEV
jgi:cation:H+ antiporter